MEIVSWCDFCGPDCAFGPGEAARPKGQTAISGKRRFVCVCSHHVRPSGKVHHMLKYEWAVAPGHVAMRLSGLCQCASNSVLLTQDIEKVTCARCVKKYTAKFAEKL